MPRTLRGRIILIAIVAIVVGLLAGRIAKRVLPLEKRAELAADAGDFAEAESLYWEQLHRGPVTVPLTIAFVEAHDRARALYAIAETVPENIRKRAKIKPQAALPEAEVEAFFTRSDLPREVSLIARLQRGGATLEVLGELHSEADRDPPMPWANHALGREAFKEGRMREAADRLEREALAFDRADDIEESLTLRLASGDRNGVITRLRDDRIARMAPLLAFRIAMEQREYGRALRWLLPYGFPKPKPGPLALAAVSAIAWFSFCARLGQMRLKPRFRVPLYLTAFVLGCLSIPITHFLIEWQQTVLNLHQHEDMFRDLVFWILGVGFREELSKLICFLPLIPLLRTKGQPLDIVTCAALVGLGFASVENLLYFTHGDLSSAIARFLTANFLHMTMTAIAGTALCKIGKTEEGFHDFTIAFLKVVVLHGLYDFFQANRLVADTLSFLSMTAFIFLARDFVLIMHDARLRAGRNKSLLPPFSYGMAAVGAASFIYGCALLGPKHAAEAMYLGMLNMAIMIVVFVRQLRAL